MSRWFHKHILRHQTHRKVMIRNGIVSIPHVIDCECGKRWDVQP